MTERGLFEKIIKPHRQPCESAFTHLNQTEKDYLMAPWCFGYAPDSKSSGPEYAYLGSLKWQLEGSMQVIIVGMKSLADYQKKVGGLVRLQAIVDGVSEADEGTLKVMRENGVQMWHAMISGGALLRVPWGFIIYEKVLNNAVVSGIRWIDTSDNYTDNFDAFVNLLLPRNRDSVKANTAQALVEKICEGISEVEPKAKRLKADAVPKAASSSAAPVVPMAKGKAKAVAAKQEQTAKRS